MMDDKAQIIALVKEEFKRWEELLSGLSEQQINTPPDPCELSIKDVVVHLWAWQQRSNARLEAALQRKEPEFPKWPPEFDPEAEGEPDQLNAWIHETYREKPWSSVYRDWKDGFHRLIELGEAIPEKDLLDPERYPLLEGYRLSDVLLGSYEHHHIDHFEHLLTWLRQHEDMKSSE
jgi:hypothetical protein